MKGITLLLLHLFVLRVFGTIYLLYTLLTLAFQITSPNEGTIWNSSGQNTLTWTYDVSVDPSDIAIFLFNGLLSPPLKVDFVNQRIFLTVLC